MSIQSVMTTADIAARRRARVLAALGVLVALLVLLSLGIGPVRLSPLTVIDALFGGGSDVQQVIVREIRLPRMILGFAIGAILGLSGAALQGLLRNPLASPSLFGAPQSAAFGAVLVISLGLADVRSWALPVAAIAAAFASVFALLAVAGRNAGLAETADTFCQRPEPPGTTEGCPRSDPGKSGRKKTRRLITGRWPAKKVRSKP